MTWLLSIFSGLWGKVVVGVAIAAVLGFGMMEVRGCMKAKAERDFLKQTLKNQGLIDKNDKIIDREKKQIIDNLQKEIEGLPPDEQAKKIKEALDKYFGGNGK